MLFIDFFYFLIKFMIVMTCMDLFANPLVYGDYVYLGLGQHLSTFIVAFPFALIILYIPYRIYMTPGSFMDVCLI